MHLFLSLLTLVAVGLSACGDGGSGAAPAASRTGATGEADSREAEEAASIPSDRAGTFELDGETFSFLVVTCDLSGTREDGMLLRGTGTVPDGRRLSVEVERLAGETVNERATVYFGGLVDGDHWTARAIQWPDGRWFADEIRNEATEGPLIRVSGNELTAEGPYRHERDDTTMPGIIHATCPT